MNMIEVDPQLFIKCRLCLEEMGMYQILPRIQKQIKYCFDFDVEPYDGLPQLLCKECENILSEYYVRKNIFVEKQQSLKKQALQKTETAVNCTEEPQQEAVSSSQLTENENDTFFKESKEEEKTKEVHVSQTNSVIGKAKSKKVSVSKNHEKEKVKSKRNSDSENNEGEKVTLNQVTLSQAEFEKENVTFKQLNYNENFGAEKFSSKEIAPLKTTIKLIKNLECKKPNDGDYNKSNNHSEPEKSLSLWKNDYNKRYICRICEIQLRKKSNIKKHVATHSLWLNDYRDIFRTNCTVVLQKIDSKPNVTHVHNTVVYDRDKIILDEGNPQYYVSYVSKSSCEANTQKDIGKRTVNRNSYYDSSGDDIMIKRSKRKRRRILSRSSSETVVIDGNNDKSDVTYTKREWSSSGAIDKTENEKPIATECINIDDTSTDSSTYKYNMHSQNDIQTSQANITDQKTIQNIISMCHNKYLKRFDSSDNITKKSSSKYSLNTESQLKHKVLSLGRKVINKQGFNSMGLLRYLESKNLDIHWIPTLNISNNKESSYVRILTKLRGSDENSNEIGWKKVPDNLLQKDIIEDKSNEMLYDSKLFVDVNADTENLNSLASATTDTRVKKNEKKYSDKIVRHATKLDDFPVLDNMGGDKSDLTSKISPVSATTDTNVKISEKKYSDKIGKHVTKVDDHTVLNNIGGNEADLTLKNKLLNANPVPNPKQLPKKSIVIETKPQAAKVANDVLVSQNDSKIGKDSDENSMIIDLDEEISSCQMPMPIITSTTSLALTMLKRENEINDHDYNYRNDISNHLTNTETTETTESNRQQTINIDKPTSWLKVKPVSELLSERVLNNLNQQSQTISNQTLVSNNLWNNSQQTQNSQTVQCIQLIKYPADKMSCAPATTSLANREYVVLDTVDLPNTKTDSPFTYFKNLLQIHDIVLLEMNEVVTPDFNCLIKFKLVFHQETTQQAPVVLCLSLLCDKNRFCFKVKDPGHEDVEVNKISANWQWEILKAYKGDVVPKLLQNAQRVSQEVFEYTKRLLCLLKSITLKSIVV